MSSAETTNNSYADLAISGLVDLTGKAGGCAMVMGGGVLAVGATVCVLPVAGATAAAATKVVNYMQDNSENELDVAQSAMNAVQYTGAKGFAAFNSARPMLFSAGYKAGSTSADVAIKLSGLAMHYAYKGAVHTANTLRYVYDNSNLSNFSMPTFPKLMPV